MRCADVVGRIELVRLERGVAEALEHICQQTNVRQQIQLHVVQKGLTVEGGPHALRMSVVLLAALRVAKLVEEMFASRQRGLSKTPDVVNVVEAEYTIPLDELDWCAGVLFSDHRVQLAEMLSTAFGERLGELIERGR